MNALAEIDDGTIERLTEMQNMSNTRLKGLRKAAILLVALEGEISTTVFKSLPEEDMEVISQEIARLGMVGRQEMLDVLAEFKDVAMVQKLLREGGYEHAIGLITQSLPKTKAQKIVRMLDAQRQAVPFHFLENAEAEVLATFLQEEHPQTIALVLSYMEATKAAEVLTSMSKERQFDIVQRIATLGHTSPEAIKRVEAGLRKHLASLAFEELQEVGGVKTVSEILNVMDRATERQILENIEEDNPELAGEIKKLMFVFEDLMMVDDKGIQNVLKEVDNKVLALALKLASEDLKGKIFKNMSKRAAELIREELQYMGPVRINDVEAAQQQVVEIVRRLEESGDAVVQGRGESSMVV
ncbi:MAG: flagellar motor switch protein FliG [Planctomycetota bacterium]